MSVGLVVGVGGIGSAVARLARRSVDNMVVFDGDPARVAELRAELGCTGVSGDIASATARDQLVGCIGELEGSLHWVALASGRGLRGPADAVSDDAVQSVMEANVLGPIALVGQLLRDARWSRGARLVGVGSISARRALPGRAVYGATKAALEAYLLAVGVEVASRGIVVNVVSAGATDTPFIGGARADLERWAAERVPAGRLGGAQEVAAVIAYLLTEAPTYLNCSRVVVDGGAEAMP